MPLQAVALLKIPEQIIRCYYKHRQRNKKCYLPPIPVLIPENKRCKTKHQCHTADRPQQRQPGISDNKEKRKTYLHQEQECKHCHCKYKHIITTAYSSIFHNYAYHSHAHCHKNNFCERSYKRRNPVTSFFSGRTFIRWRGISHFVFLIIKSILQ